jgi:hypothetical protein
MSMAPVGIFARRFGMGTITGFFGIRSVREFTIAQRPDDLLCSLHDRLSVASPAMVGVGRHSPDPGNVCQPAIDRNAPLGNPGACAELASVPETDEVVRRGVELCPRQIGAEPSLAGRMHGGRKPPPFVEVAGAQPAIGD